MQTTEKIWFNGKLLPWDDAKIHILTHTLHYGGGAFEGIRFYNTDKGPAIFKLSEHVDRLLFSTNILRMNLPYNKEQIMSAILEVARVNKLKEGYLRPIAFYGYGKMGVNPIGSPSDLAIACWPWGAYLPQEGVDIKTSSYTRINPHSTNVNAKLCGHYVNGILASLELQGTHYHEALFLDNDGYISEGVGENFFLIKDNIIYTPMLGTILPGITRTTIINLAARLNLKVMEANLRIEDAYDADEAFFTGTAAEVTSIRSIDDKILGHGKERTITTALKKDYLDIVHGKNTDYLEALTFLSDSE